MLLLLLLSLLHLVHRLPTALGLPNSAAVSQTPTQATPSVCRSVAARWVASKAAWNVDGR